MAAAIGGVMISGSLYLPANAATQTWNSTTSSDWFTAANWSGDAVPGSADTAFFGGAAPLSNTISIGSSVNVGAIFVENPSNPAVTISGGGTVTLFGQTLTVPQVSGTLSNEPNVVLAFGSTSAATNTINIGDNLALNSTQNVIVASPNSGLSAAGQTINISGNITGTGAALTLLGGGTPADYGASYNLTGTNSFTGGLVIGTSSATQGATVEVDPSALPTTGTIVVNEQGQLLLNAAGTYGAGTTLDLNGPGVGPGVSQGSSGALRTAGKGQSYTYAGNVNIGASTSGSSALGYVVISSTGTNTLTFSGQVTGSGNIQKQGSGFLILSGSGNTWSGSLQIGNGAVNATANSSIGTGDLQFFQTSTNTTTVNLFNAAQTIGNLSSNFTLTTGSDTQALNLNGTALTIDQTMNTTFGYGAVSGLTSMIQDGTVTPGGSVIYNGKPGAELSLTGPNSYTGGTTITGGVLNLANGANGSALGAGDVTVASGGTLSSGGGITVLGQAVSAGGLSGNLTVDSGGIVTPGGANLIGSLGIGGSLTAHDGSAFDFDLLGGTTAQSDDIAVTGDIALDTSGNETVNISGSKLAYGTYTLATFGALANSGTQFTLGTTPGGTNRTYSLTTNANDLILNITDTGSERYWSVGGSDPSVDGGGTWAAGSTNFFTSNPVVAQAPYDNTSNNPVIIGNGGNGGTITLGGAVRVGGALVLSQASTPYTIGTPGGTNTLQLAQGIDASNDTTINAPIIFEASQTFTADAGVTVSINGGISQTGGSQALTISNPGTFVLGGVSSYTGGTTIAQGTLQTSTQSLPATGGITNNSSLIFSESSNGAYSGVVSGTGTLTVNNPLSTATVTLGNAFNSYSGATNVESGVLSIGSTGALGTGAGGINLSGGTLQFTAPLIFPLGSPSQSIDLASGTSTIDTDGNNVTLGQNLSGSGNLTKIGGGTLTLTGLVPTTIIGQVAILGGAMNFNPGGGAGGASYGISGSSSPGTYTGDLDLSGSLELRYYGGDINGGGAVRFLSSGINFVSEGVTTVDNQIILNQNNISNFIANIGATAGNTLAITSAITGDSDVDFTGGAGVVYLQGQSTYTGATTIDNGAAGEIQIDVNNALPTGTDVHLTSNAILDVFGVSQTIGSLDSGGAGTNALVTDNSSNNATLIINGSKSTNFAGFITDNANTPGGGGELAIELGSNYSGALTLNSTTFNSYSGGTILNGGTLVTSSDALLGYSTGGLTFGGGTLALAASSGLVTTSRPITVNPGNSTIDVGSGNSFAISGSPSLTWAGGTLNFTDSANPVSISQTGGTVSVTPGSVLAVSSTASVTVDGSVDPFTDVSNSSHHVAIINNGAFSVVDVNSSITGITGTGAVTIGDGSVANTLQLATNSGGSDQNSLIINGNSSLDITNNHIVLADAGGNIDSTIRDYLINGYNNGNWNGASTTGSIITSSVTGTKFGIGYADGADGGISGITSGQLEVKYTLYGDANLDGSVNSIDFGDMAANFGKSGKVWDQGDFNYDGVVNSVDFGLLAGNFGKSVGGNADVVTASDWAALDAFAATNGLMADVPEPASASLALLAGVGILGRRRRSTKR
jgi:autotransporter-associated beta strand protein